MTTIHDAQIGELVLDGDEFRATLERAGREIPFSIQIEDLDALAMPIDLLPVNLDKMLGDALARVRSKDEHWVREYVEHHLDQLEPDDWRGVLPEGSDLTPDTIRASLHLRKVWGSHDGDGLSLNLDHGLPAALTDYVISVQIDASGEIEGTTMES